MKGFGKLLKSMIRQTVALFIVALFLVALLAGAGYNQSLEIKVGLTVLFLIFLTIAIAILLVYGIVVCLIYTKAKEKLYAIPGFSEERFLREIDRAPQINRILLCSDAICYTGTGYIIKTIPIQDIVWAYQEQVQAVPYVQIYTKDREKHTIPVTIRKKFGTPDAACRYILRLIARKNKGALIGYEESYEAMCKNAFNQLLMRAQQGEIVDSRLLEQEYIQNDYYIRDLQ